MSGANGSRRPTWQTPSGPTEPEGQLTAKTPEEGDFWGLLSPTFDSLDSTQND